MLLSFAFQNFRSFADAAELSLTASSFRTNVPRDGQSWADVSERVAAIYGPNASGKSTVLEAILALSEAIRSPGGGMIYQPSLSGGYEDDSVCYEVDFVAQNVRHRYEIVAGPWGIVREELFAYPKATARRLFTRTQKDEDAPIVVTAGDSLNGPTAEVRRITKPTMLFLATARKYGHSGLAPIAAALVAGVGIDFISFRERLDEVVLQRVIMEMVAAPHSQIDLIKALVQTADLGVESIEVRSEVVSDADQQRLIRILKALNEGEEVSEEQVPKLRDVVAFRHRADGDRIFELPLAGESSGTITWLTTAWHALDALRQGSLLLIDELDASLHPDLARYVVGLFLSPELNPHGAQLIFTSHDVSLLGNSPVRLLDPHHIWYVEKDIAGRSELFSQSDFDNRAGNNTERRYLAGKFGAVPEIDDGLLLRFIASAAHQEGANIPVEPVTSGGR